LGLLIWRRLDRHVSVCAYSFRLVAVVRIRHLDRPRIDASVLDRRKNAVVPERGEGASIKGNWIRSSCCCLPWHSCWAIGLQRMTASHKEGCGFKSVEGTSKFKN
jgi:hypothetical protein